MAKKPRHPKNAMVIRDYEKFEQYISTFADGHLNLLILISNAGTGKSYSVRKAVGDRALFIEGSATAFGIYQALYRNINRPVVIDDVDELFRDRSAIRLLKCLCQTDPVKRLGWYTNATSNSDVPQEFETSSQTIIIANEWETLNHNVGAVQDRGHLLFFEPTLEALHGKVAEWFWDQEIYDFVGRNLHHFPGLSMRSYVNAAELKTGGLDWMDVLYAECKCKTALMVAKLLADETFEGEAQRLAAFRERGGGGKTTYFKYKKKLTAMNRRKSAAAPRVVEGQAPNRPPRLCVVPREAG